MVTSKIPALNIDNTHLGYPAAKNKKVLVSLSGGVDSTTLLYWLLAHDMEPYPVFFLYGSKHNQMELKAAQAVVNHLNMELKIVDTGPLWEGCSSSLMQQNSTINTGEYSEKNMADTVVPARNMVFASIMAAVAASNDYSYIAFGIHGGDHHIYPDCRLEFWDAFWPACFLASDIHTLTPFANWDKSAIVRWGIDAGVPYGLTKSCYNGDMGSGCGKCSTCQERRSAFLDNGVIDPIAVPNDLATTSW